METLKHTPQNILSAGRLLARAKAPYFRSMLLGFAMKETPGLGTIGVTEDGILLVDFEFVAKVTPEEMAGLLIHEAMHVCLTHSKRARRAGRDPRIDNMAADLAINPAIVDMGMQLPGGEIAGLFPEKFGWSRGLTADEYYELLRKDKSDAEEKAKQENGAKGKGKAQGQGKGGKGDPDDDDHDGDGDGDGGNDADHANPGKGKTKSGKAGSAGHKPQTGGGWCGSCAGRAMPNEPDKTDAAARSTAELERLTRQVAEAMREHAQKGRGTLPGGWSRWAEQALEPSRIPWQAKLARITRSACAWRPGAVDHRYDVPGRRQAGIGYGPGKAILPRFRQPVPNVTVIMDTSGSMGTLELSEAARETNGILKAIGADITLTVVDAQVHGLTKVRRIEEALAMLKGGGGTDMRPGFEAAMKHRPRPEVIICITDGCVGDGVPAQAPSGVKVIWLLVGQHQQVPATWGEVIAIEPTATLKVA